MKTSVRIGLAILVTTLSGLLGGCASQSASAHRREPLNDFEVVETSSKRRLTAREMAYLKQKVADYLQAQGETGSGDFYVKILLGEEPGVAPGEWVIVRFTRYPSAYGGTLALYEPSGYLDYPPYGSYDYLPWGWVGFGALAMYHPYDSYYPGFARYARRWYQSPHSGDRWDRDGKRHGQHGHHGNRGPDGRPRDRDKDDGKPKHGGGDRWTHHNHNGPAHRPAPSGLGASNPPAPANRQRWENRPDRGGDRDRDRVGARREFQRPDPDRERRRDFTPRTVSPNSERTATPVPPTRLGGQRERGPAYAAPPPGSRPRTDAAQSAVPSARQRSSTPTPAPAPPPRRESRDDSRASDSSQSASRSERSERSGGQVNSSGESRRAAPPAVSRPMAPDGGRRARER